MKKLGYLMGAALLTLGSCTNEINEEGFVDKANTISFNAYSNKTRAYTNGDINNATAMQNGSFGVVGYKSNSTIYLGSTTSAISQSFSNTTNHWEYTTLSDLKYWPDGNMDFYAYFPYSENGATFAESTSTDGTVMTINNATGNQDVLFASAIDQGYKARVPLTFNHAFSKVNSVNIKVELNDVNVVVKKVEFINTTSSANSKVLVNKSGKASYGEATGTTSTCGHELESAVIINSTGDYKDNGYAVWTSTDNKYLLATQGDDETNKVTGTNIAMWDGTNDDWDESDKLSTKGLVCLKITGKVTTHDGTEYLVGSANQDGDIYIPLKGANHTTVGEGATRADIEHFFAGKRYSYSIIMKDNVGFKDNGDPILKPILFNASVTGWDDVNVTINL